MAIVTTQLSQVVFVSPELSSGRDLVIHFCAPCAVPIFLSGAFLRNRMPYLDDIWYVGGARAEVVHAEFWVWHMLIKDLICIIYSKTCLEHFSGTVCPTLMIFGIWVGLGPEMRMLNFGRGTSWSPGVKNVKQCSRTTKLGQKNC